MNNEMQAMMSLEKETTAFPCYSLPIKSAYFYGREQQLQNMSEHLDPSRPEDDLRTVVIYGLGGIGKTALATAFSQQCRSSNRFDAIFWIRSQTMAEIRDSCFELTQLLGFAHTGGAADRDSNILKIKNWLSNASMGMPAFLSERC